jgi:hypothetical protein
MTKPAMNGVRTRKGDIVIGATLVLAGVAVMLDRTGVFPWRDHLTLWPLVLGGIGLARFLQSIPGQPKQGLLFITVAVWLFLNEAGWVSLEDSWPIIIIVLGVIVALNGGRGRPWHIPAKPGEPGDPGQVKRLRRPDHPLSPLATVGIWIAVFVALQVSGIRTLSNANNDTGAEQRVHVVSVMGRSEHISRATTFQGGNITNVMGQSELNLHDATLAPGATATVHVFSAMGTVVLRVPPTWTIDAGAVSALGRVRDDRAPMAESEAPAGQAPRLEIRGLVMFGRLMITS